MHSLNQILLTLLLILLAPTAALADDADTTLSTRITMLIGFPGDSGGASVTVVPGMVIPLATTTPGAAATIARQHGDQVAATKVASGLERNLGLERVEVGAGKLYDLAVDATQRLAGPTKSSTIEASVTLLSIGAEIATYRVQLLQGALVLADSPVAVLRGGRAIVGGLDGEEAPYFFLVLEPAADDADVYKVEGDVTAPVALVKQPPGYPEQARKNKTQGVVILQVVIDETGTISKVEALKEQPDGLTEAAIEAVRQWQFEPAKLDGKPVAVYYNLTINFRLDSDGAKSKEPPPEGR